MVTETLGSSSMANAESLPPVHIHIEPPRGWIPLDLRQYRDVLRPCATHNPDSGRVQD